MKPSLWILLLLFSVLEAFAGEREHGTLVRAATLYVSPGSTAEKLMQVERGRDMVVLEHTNTDNAAWLKVFVTIGQGESEREVTGWLRDKGVIVVSTPGGDLIVFGEAEDSENQAEQRGGRKGAAQDAMRLYYRLTELFPKSLLAPEALWRSADIRWQLEKADVMFRTRELNPQARAPLDDRFLKEVIKRFPGSKWADLAAYDLIDNSLCGEWKGLATCPEKEAALYEQYADEHPRSPKATEALYNAAWRNAALVDIYRINDDGARSSNARKRAIFLARKIVQLYPESGDWKARAVDLIYKVEHDIPLYGSQTD
jgi:hypothetical protein